MKIYDADLIGSLLADIFEPNSILIATADNTPTALTVPASTILGRKSSGGIVALTGAEAGEISGISPGAKMLFYNDTAPTGWTISNTLDDKLVYITKGSSAGGQTGGTVHSTGAWTNSTNDTVLSSTQIPSHTHTASSSVSDPGHTHYGATGGYINTYTSSDNWYAMYWQPTYTGSSVTGISVSTSIGTTGGGLGHSHPMTNWRPAAYCCIICTKN